MDGNPAVDRYNELANRMSGSSQPAHQAVYDVQLLTAVATMAVAVELRTATIAAVLSTSAIELSDDERGTLRKQLLKGLGL